MLHRSGKDFFCLSCGRRRAARILGFCRDCLQAVDTDELKRNSHISRAKFGLPAAPPGEAGAPVCSLCSNLCRPDEGSTGFCGVRANRNGAVRSIAPEGVILADFYYDPLPTNCCAAWFCPGSKEKGVNLAVFLYGCNFDCLFCQNASHRRVDSAPHIPLEHLVKAALREEVRCVCFFGGSPEPQLQLAVEAAREIIQRSSRRIHICWEWNGAGNPALVKQAVEISHDSGGTVKFDLKAWSPSLGKVLCGVSIERTYQNLRLLWNHFQNPELLTATTLLVPYYVDESEVENIACFLAELSPDFPYSLLVFHPEDRMNDLPVTPRSQVEAALKAARNYLRRVHAGNLHLLSD